MGCLQIGNGPGGIGVNGFACNLSDELALEPEFKLAIPLLRGMPLFLTLYLHLDVGGVDGRVLCKLAEGQAIEQFQERLEKAMAEQQRIQDERNKGKKKK